MTTSQAIKIIYDATEKKLDKTRAREMVAVTIENIISDLVDSGDLSPENLEAEIEKEALYFLSTMDTEAA